jgi:hypothetical protein
MVVVIVVAARLSSRAQPAAAGMKLSVQAHRQEGEIS